MNEVRRRPRKTPKENLNEKLDQFVMAFKPEDFKRIGK